MTVTVLFLVFCFWIVLAVFSAFVSEDAGKFYAWLLAVLLISLVVGCGLTIVHSLISR